MRTLIFILIFIYSTLLNATDIRLDMGAGLFYTGAHGKIEYVEETFQGSYANTEIPANGQFYVWGDITTNNPWIPTVRLEYLKISAEGDSTAHIASAIPELQALIDEYLNNSKFPLNDKAWNSLLQHNVYDINLYYEFFQDSGWPSLGVGLGYKYFDYIYIMDIAIDGIDLSGVQFGDRDSSGAPMLFLKSRYDATSLQLGFEGNAKVYLFGDSQMYDWKVKVDWLFDLSESTEGGFEFGYRDQYYKLQGGDVERVKGDMHYQGVFFGGVLHFN